MKKHAKDELKKIYKARVDRIADYLVQHDIGTAIFIDSEEHREPAIRYLTGHTSDAVLIVFSDGYDILIPWDEMFSFRQNDSFYKIQKQSCVSNKKRS